jgi:hypothetical protein
VIRPTSGYTLSLWAFTEYEDLSSAISCRSPDTENPADAGFLIGDYRPTVVIGDAFNERLLNRGNRAFNYSY